MQKWVLYRHNIRRYRRAYGEKRGVQYPPFASSLGAPRAQRDTADNADKVPVFLHRERSEIRRMLAGFWRMLALPVQGVLSPLLPFGYRLRCAYARARSAIAPPARRAQPAHATRLRRGRGSPSPHALRACAAAAPRSPRCARRARDGAAGRKIAQVMSVRNGTL